MLLIGLFALMGVAATVAVVDLVQDDDADSEQIPQDDTPEESDNSRGTAGDDDVYIGSNAAFDGLLGDDTIEASDGATISGGAGDDSISVADEGRVYGGAGDDTIFGEHRSTLFGGEGSDRITAHSYSGVFGGDGDDSLGNTSGTSNTTLRGEDGDDRLWVTSSSVAFGGDGNDTLYGLNGSTLHGGAGDDEIETAWYIPDQKHLSAFGNDGNDTLTIWAGLGHGGAGDDVLMAEVDDDLLDRTDLITLTGGEGTDSFTVSFGSAERGWAGPDPLTSPPLVTITDFDPETEQLLIEDHDSAPLESLEIQPAADGSYTDVIAQFEEDLIKGRHRDDYHPSFAIRLDGVSSLSEEDIRVVNSSDGTTLALQSGTQGDDTLVAASDTYVLTGSGDDQVMTSQDNSTVHAGGGNDTVLATARTVSIYGGMGDDSISLSGEGSYAYGGNGSDTITAHGENVTVHGGTGDDTLVSERGTEASVFYGGSGFNTFEIGLGDTVNLATDGNYTLNVYPEDLEGSPALIDGVYLPEADVILNLPPDVTGDLSLRSVMVEGERFPFQAITVTTQSSQDLLTVNTKQDVEASLDLFTINRDVVF
ncbi:calcium-binding protein [Falsiruegeria mediterranea]|uniref:Hemolysin, plasmid n=1 Tax=Falsiruegeria mediterranea M17 TaxID=1200281 RepID=A0A2R8C7A6_9RHOB|nr:hypothetical protein [Falsiruegeria mediterranea]SPJ28319.1 Hemolysin, plasmid [Falsiruegeria mediterranea M17]